MKIAIFTDVFPPQMNGVVSHVLETAIELVKNGHDVIVFAPKPRIGIKINVAEYNFKTILITSLPALFYPNIRITIPAMPRILYELRKFNPDVVHIMDPMSVGTEGLSSAKILKKPIALSFHSFFMDKEFLALVKLGRGERLLRKPIWALTTRYFNLADVVICQSEIAKKELIKYGLTKPVEIVSNGIDLRKITKVNKNKLDQLRHKWKISRNDKVGLIFGRISVDKSIDILLKAWSIVVKTIPAAKLIIIGSGPQEEKLKQLVKSLRIGNNIIFTGGIEREKIFQTGIINLADLYVTASKIENQSLAMIEAMAHGLPLVGVNARGTPELINHNNGIIVKPDNPKELAKAIIKILLNPDLAKKFGQQSQDKVKDFDIRNCTKKLEATYRVLAKYKTV